MAKKKAITELPYKVSLTLNSGKVFSGEGNTLEEAMASIEIKGIVKELGTLTATYGEKKVIKVCNALKLQRMFGESAKTWVRDIARKIFCKYINSGL